MSARKITDEYDGNFRIEEVEEISKDLKKIKVDNFPDAYKTFKKALPKMFSEKEFHQFHGIFKVSGLNIGPDKNCQAFIAKKLRCKGITGKDKFRIVFQVDGEIIYIIEVYFKGNKEIEDKARIRKYCIQNNGGP